MSIARGASRTAIVKGRQANQRGRHPWAGSSQSHQVPSPPQLLITCSQRQPHMHICVHAIFQFSPAFGNADRCTIVPAHIYCRSCLTAAAGAAAASSCNAHAAQAVCCLEWCAGGCGHWMNTASRWGGRMRTSTCCIAPCSSPSTPTPPWCQPSAAARPRPQTRGCCYAHCLRPGRNFTEMRSWLQAQHYSTSLLYIAVEVAHLNGMACQGLLLSTYTDEWARQ